MPTRRQKRALPMARNHRIRKFCAGSGCTGTLLPHSAWSKGGELPRPRAAGGEGARPLPNSMPLCHFEGDWPHGGATRPDSRCKKTSAGREPRTTLRRASRPMLSQWQIRTNASRETLGRAQKTPHHYGCGGQVRGFALHALARDRCDPKRLQQLLHGGRTTSGMDAVGSKRRTTLPSRSTRNFVKFHLMSGLPA